MKNKIKYFIDKIKYEYHEKQYTEVIDILVNLSDDDLLMLRDLINEEYDWRFSYNVRSSRNFTDTIN